MSEDEFDEVKSLVLRRPLHVLLAMQVPQYYVLSCTVLSPSLFMFLHNLLISPDDGVVDLLHR